MINITCTRRKHHNERGGTLRRDRDRISREIYIRPIVFVTSGGTILILLEAEFTSGGVSGRELDLAINFNIHSFLPAV